MNRDYIAHRLRVYAQMCDDAPTTIALGAATVTFILVGAAVAADLRPKARLARWLARRVAR